LHWSGPRSPGTRLGWARSSAGRKHSLLTVSAHWPSHMVSKCPTDVSL